jgi:pSer/pThr/pTyr-binding forkhead associated (FHA) protein
MARLSIVGGNGVEQVVELSDRRMQIGRGRDNDIVLPDSEKGVSRTHAELRLENDRYVIVDLQSQNGTWLNGCRVERAEVPYGAEIAVGAYRLSLLKDRPAVIRPATAGPRPADPLDDMRATERHDPAAFRQPQPSPSAFPGGTPRWVLGGVVAMVIVLAVAAIVWMSTAAPGVAPRAAAGTAATTNGETPGVPPTPAVPERPAERTPDTSELPAGPPVKRDAPMPAVTARPDAPRIGRRPGESADAWRTRGAALQMRYGYSKAALDRGDFAAAAGGFEAILMEEPGFLDAPKLLVQAQSGLRASGRSLFQAGGRLEAAGDWVGSLQKYEQARQVYADIPGLADGLKRVKGKLAIAGTTAFSEARRHEAGGRPQEALKEYEKALQWLASDDPNRQVARTRIEQLKKND